MCDGKGRCRRHPIYNKVGERPKPSPTDREEDASRHHATNREQKQPIARNIITNWKSVQLGRSIKADCDKKVTSWAADSSGNQTQERQQIDNKAFMRNKDYKRRKKCSRFVGRTKRTERAPKQPSCRCRPREMRQIGRENRRQGHCPERQKGNIFRTIHQQRQPPFFQPHPTIAAGRTSTGRPIRHTPPYGRPRRSPMTFPQPARPAGRTTEDHPKKSTDNHHGSRTLATLPSKAFLPSD